MTIVPELRAPNVIGWDELAAKQSAVDAQGALRRTPIHDVVFRPTRPVPHEDGHVTEVARADWDQIGGPIVQVHLTTTLPGRHRAWGLHQRSTDRLFVMRGSRQVCRLRRPDRVADLWQRERGHAQREKSWPLNRSAKPISRVEEYRHR